MSSKKFPGPGNHFGQKVLLEQSTSPLCHSIGRKPQDHLRKGRGSFVTKGLERTIGHSIPINCDLWLWHDTSKLRQVWNYITDLT
jgi:hypothetical protein